MRKKIISLLLLVSGSISSVYADTLALRENAPDRYVVVKGDTLWDISGKFLQKPWRWPEIWALNKQEIKDPHWIYPGDVILLDRSGAEPRLRLLRDANNTGRTNGVVKLSPRIRSEQLVGDAAPSIPFNAIKPFLNRPLVIDNDGLANAPRIAAGPDNRVYFTAGDRVYAVDLQGEAGSTWHAFRPGRPLIDPDDPEKKRVIGTEVDYLGDAVVDVPGEVATLRIVANREEVAIGSRLIEAEEMPFMNYAPHAPEQEVKAKVVAAYGGVAEAGPYTTIVLNRGSDDGLDIGSVLEAFKAPRLIKKENKEEPDRFTPPEKSGNVFIYRVFPRVSYGLVLNSTLPVNVGDEVNSPR
ncbi:LysM peptidoglycan-binding domain-containing protein [Chitiniphilus purpureus]|uniref:LysM peptidoglycan-binding domain-containing protein n=1 Tax=Chitiniphilus purpureus TaxID=2981137 RepID=A0ABY6DL03_9NEIS|nr:LysM peptidoglycan-binding domain-containing protein [Chitiniphilus sp. CD1]UXY15040.1 LysM peptidoglycan-binding domain-containing protein [Chitiniphilus sp. CD1]